MNPDVAAATVLAQFVRDLANSALSESDLLHRLAATAAEFTRAEGACVLELDHAEDAFVVTATSGHLTPFEGHRYTIQPPPSLFRDVIASGQTACMFDEHDPRIDGRFREQLRIRQAACVPIVLDSVVSGLLLCLNSASGTFDSASLDLLGHLADHSALALRSERLIQQARRAAEEARQRAAEAARAAQHHAVIARTARGLADAITRESVYDAITRLLRDEVHAAGFAIFDANPQLASARLDHQSGIGLISATRIATVFFDTVLGDVVRSATPLFVADFDRWIDGGDVEGGRELIEAGVQSVALLPLVLDGTPCGLLSVRFAERHDFDDSEQRLLLDIATQVAVAYRNLGHLAELERRATRLGAMTRAQTQLTHVTTPDTLPAAIAEAAHSVFPTAVCDVMGEAAGALTRVLTMRDGHVARVAPASDDELTLARATLHSGVSRLAVHTDTCAHWERGAAEMCAVVRYGTRTVGVLRVIADAPDAFDLQDLDLLTILARQAGAAAETARLFMLQDFQRQRAEGAAELARVTLQAVNVADGAMELLGVLDRSVPSIGKAIGVARARDGVVEYVATSGTLDVLRGHRTQDARDPHVAAGDMKPREVASLRSIAPPEVGTAMPEDWGFMVPLATRDRMLGVLIVAAPRTVPLPRRDRVTLERLSTSLALALDALLLDEDERFSREREHLLATALTTIDHPIFILDRVGVRYANPAAAREYGWSQVELMDMQFEQLVAGVDPRHGRGISDGMMESGISPVQHVHRRRDGSEFPAAVTASSLLAQDGDVLGQVVSVRNVSADRRVEEQLRHTEKMVALGELVAGVAHEINNPLTGISAFAQILLEEPLGDDQRESVQLIKQESNRAKAVIKDLLLFARKADSTIGPVDLNDLIEQTLRLRAYPLRHAGVKVVLETDPQVPAVPGDPQKLQQVLLNLFGNAEHAMLDRPTRVLTVRTSASNGEVQISIADTGRGMTAEVQRRIFEPFFTTKPDGSGTGLGLSVSYGIVQAHGGRIDVQSEADVGTTVILTLPVRPPVAALADDALRGVIGESAPDPSSLV